jgi:hypothetical protein
MKLISKTIHEKDVVSIIEFNKGELVTILNSLFITSGISEGSSKVYKKLEDLMIDGVTHEI